MGNMDHDHCDMIEEIFAILSRIGTPDYIYCDDDIPLFVVLKSLIKSDMHRKVITTHGMLNGINVSILMRLFQDMDGEIVSSLWSSLDYMKKVEFFMQERQISDMCFNDGSPVAKLLILSGRDIAQWCLEQATGTCDWNIVRLILDNAPDQWLQTDELREEMEDNHADDETIRALECYRMRMAKKLVVPLLLAQSSPDASCDISQPVAAFAENRYLMEYLIKTIADN